MAVGRRETLLLQPCNKQTLQGRGLTKLAMWVDGELDKLEVAMARLVPPSFKKKTSEQSWHKSTVLLLFSGMVQLLQAL